MRLILLILGISMTLASSAYADCTQEEVCKMLRKLDHFSILDRCPGAGPLLVECKKSANKKVEDLPEPNFVDNGDGTVTDTVNQLVWVKKGIQKKLKLKDAKMEAIMSQAGGRSGWRLPSLAELKTLLYHERVKNASGKKAWIHPIFEDGRGHYYWTTTTCDEVTVIEDRYQRKTCQVGDQAAWLVHFNINAVFWFYTDLEKPYVWLVQNLESEEAQATK